MTAAFNNLAMGGRLGPLAIEVLPGGHLASFAGATGTRLGQEIDQLASMAPRRADSAGGTVIDFSSAVCQLNSRRDAAKAQAHYLDPRQEFAGLTRADSGVGAGLGGAEPRDLTYRMPDLNENLPPLQSLQLFAVDNSVPDGAIDFEVRRNYGAGEAIVYRGGGDIPVVGLGQATLIRYTRYLVTSFEESWIDRRRAAFRGYSETAQKMLIARDTLLRTADQLFWDGSVAHDLWGVLNYPFLDTGVSATKISSGSTAAAIVEAVSSAAYYSHVESKMTYTSNACVMSPRLFRYLSTTLVGTGDNSTTILKFLKEACPHIKRWEQAWKMQSAGPTSDYDGMLFYRDDQMGICPIVTLPPTMLPAQSFGIVDKTMMVMGIGGALMKEVGNNLLMFFDVSA